MVNRVINELLWGRPGKNRNKNRKVKLDGEMMTLNRTVPGNIRCFLTAALPLTLLLSCGQNRGPEPGIYFDNIAVEADVVYDSTAPDQNTLDVYYPARLLGTAPWTEVGDTLRPTLVYFHGGGWSSGDKVSRSLLLLPYLEKKFVVINADYRLLSQNSNIDDCINDGVSVLRWIAGHHSKYGIDTNQIYLSGESAGGHIALMVSKRYTDLKISRSLSIRGIVNWYGITDVAEATRIWNRPEFTKLIAGPSADTDSVLFSASPVNFINQSQPPVITIHGSLDDAVPVSQSRLFHDKLSRVGVANKLVVIDGKKHGNFSSGEQRYAFAEIWKFLSPDK
ncbi:MAG TPA: alpha/beta hydrolase [Chryseosolibacter sp.]